MYDYIGLVKNMEIFIVGCYYVLLGGYRILKESIGKE